MTLARASAQRLLAKKLAAIGPVVTPYILSRGVRPRSVIVPALAVRLYDAWSSERDGGGGGENDRGDSAWRGVVNLPRARQLRRPV